MEDRMRALDEAMAALRAAQDEERPLYEELCRASDEGLADMRGLMVRWLAKHEATEAALDRVDAVVRRMPDTGRAPH